MVLLAYIGNPSSHRQGQTIVIVMACATIIGLRGLTVWGEGLLRSNAYMIYLVWGLPLIQMVYFGGILTTDHNAVPQSVLTWFDKVSYQINQFIEPLRQRLFGDKLAVEEA